MKSLTFFFFLLFSLKSWALFDPKISNNGKCLVTGLLKNQYCVNEMVFFENDTEESTQIGNGKIVKIILGKDKRPKARIHVREGSAMNPNTKLPLNLKGRVLVMDSSDLYKAEEVKK